MPMEGKTLFANRWGKQDSQPAKYVPGLYGPGTTVCQKPLSWPPAPTNSALRPAPPHVCGQALRYAGVWLCASWLSAISGASRPSASLFCGQALRFAGAWLRASWLSAISGASRPSASLGGGLRTAVALRAVLVLGAAHP